MGREVDLKRDSGYRPAGQDARPTGAERKTEVRCRSGYRGDEYPVSFASEGHNYRVRGIVARSLEEDSETGERKRLFVVATHEGRKFRLIHSEGSDTWRCSEVATD